MANSQICIFCGKQLSFFSKSYQTIEGKEYDCCMDCAAEVSKLSEYDLCQRALRIPGMLSSEDARAIRTHIEVMEQAEKQRPKCPLCSAPMYFRKIERLDNTPRSQDGLFSSTFDILPMYCPNCCKMELFWPEMLEKNKELAYLYRIDCK